MNKRCNDEGSSSIYRWRILTPSPSKREELPEKGEKKQTKKNQMKRSPLIITNE